VTDRNSAGDPADPERKSLPAAPLDWRGVRTPDVILAHGTSTVGPLLQATRAVPIVFPVISDPVGSGFVESLARPGGNVTAAEIQRAVTAFSRFASGGVIVTASALSVIHRDLIIGLAARHRLPVVYFERFFVTAGGLISYGADQIDQYRRAAGYVDRILRGEKPGDLPVQAPTKYETVCGGRKSYAEARPEVVALAKELRGQHMSPRKISAALAARGYVTAGGKPYVATAVQAMLG
jgi:ABC-type uncharacterized transport system substrate-binding protein